ncbi:MAG: molybdopterin-guanine dinucleotide biosynthesis protein B [Candidatus Bathyarchaeia archaeon]
MGVDIPAIAVLGHKNSGKTTVIQGLISELMKKHLHVATAKHISLKNFSMDTVGSDTWHHSMAGANPVIVVSDDEACVMMKDGEEKISLEKILKFAQENRVDALLFEGFSYMVLDNARIGKIVCLRNREEYNEFKDKITGEVVAFCSLQKLGGSILKINEDVQVLAERVMKFIEKRGKISEILNSLAGLDCRKCGKASCDELAEDIYEGKASLDDCLPFRIKSKLKTKILIENIEVPLQPFVSEFIRKTILGMLSALKDVTIKGDEYASIEILKRRNT